MKNNCKISNHNNFEIGENPIFQNYYNAMASS